MDHLILTRFNVRRWGDAPLEVVSREVHARRIERFTTTWTKWLRGRVRFFERFCLPSVAQQTCTNFRWLVFFDNDSSSEVKRWAALWAEALPALTPIYVGPFSADVPRRAVLQHSKSEWVATTRLDSDDAIHFDFVASVRRALRAQREALNFPKGWLWDARRVRPCTHEANMFLTAIEKRSEAKTALGYLHRRIYDVMPLRQLAPSRMWLSVAHDGSIGNIPGRDPKKPREPESVVANNFGLMTEI